ncbi:MAG: YHS domain protein [Azospira oryzae]|jgi:YHS domain-containing protein|nr:MAG: YHS domain protein [Azospira oryzae]
MKHFTLLFSFLLLITTSLSAQVEPVGKDKVAIGGYDVVAYFNTGKATKGNASISSTNNGILYYFASAENKDAFVKNPDAYLPQYDGYCALAVGAQNKKVSINPEAFKITDGKLYLFFNGELPLSRKKFNSIEPWNRDEDALIKKADANWPALKAKKK